MEDVMRRYSAALLGFGFVAVWAGLGFMSAVYCLIGCAVSYLAPGIARRRGVAGPVRLSQTSLPRRSPARPSRAKRCKSRTTLTPRQKKSSASDCSWL